MAPKARARSYNQQKQTKMFVCYFSRYLYTTIIQYKTRDKSTYRQERSSLNNCNNKEYNQVKQQLLYLWTASGNSSSKMVVKHLMQQKTCIKNIDNQFIKLQDPFCKNSLVYRGRFLIWAFMESNNQLTLRLEAVLILKTRIQYLLNSCWAYLA